MFKKNKTEITNNGSYGGQPVELLTNVIDDVFIILAGNKLEVEYVSPNVERILGISEKEVLKSVRSLGQAKYIDDKEVTMEDVLRIPVGSSDNFLCGREHGKTKEQRFFSETVYHLKDDGGDKYVLKISDRTNDILVKQSLEEALAIAKIANQSKTTFLANMSHDIRTPMNTIVGLCTLLQRDIGNREKLMEHVKHITVTSRHMLTLINDILDMSKIEAESTTLSEGELSVSEIVKELNVKIAPQAKAKRQTLNTTISVRDDKFLGDGLRIKRAIANILSNAVQYTPDGGRIDFAVQQISRPSRKYAYMQFVIKDNGIGMSEEFLKKIFIPFTREQHGDVTVQGTGLGMPIAKNLIDLMGGTVSIESKLGEGTKVVVNFKFPLTKTNDADFWIAQGITRMLVVGGNNIDNNSITWAMRKSGVQISFAKSLKAACSVLEKAMAEGKGYNVVLFDWNGKDKNANDVKAVRESVSEYVPLIAFGDCEWDKTEAKAAEAGADAFLPNPFLLAEFRECVENLKKGKREGVPAEQEKSVLDGMRFLAAEDNELNAMVLVELLKVSGATCVVKANGQEAVNEFVASEEGYYDGVLMDIQM
ncbi:MAG: hybrid sensor histidine kinase/response regulator, partial [Clostridia bacterium]|nr:hybrid sensor histidine kinase/response regulator [Clostridia bacterium]